MRHDVAQFERLPVGDGRVGAVFDYDRTHEPMRRGHRHEEWEVNLVTGGRASYVIDGRRVEMGRDALLWLLPSQGHLLIERSTDFRMWIGVFRPAALRPLGVAAWAGWLDGGTAEGPLLREVGEAAAGRLTPLFETLHGELTAGHQSAGLAFLAAEAWRAFEAAPDRPAGSHLHPAVAAAVDFLAEHAHEPAADDLDALADRVHLSRPHLSRLFRRQVGQSLTEFRNRQRVRHLRRLVGRGGGVSLTEAAYASGFGSYTQCFRVVKQLTGSSPKELMSMK